MIPELLHLFKQHNSTQLVADIYKPGPGLYLQIHLEQGDQINTLFIDKDTTKGDLYHWFAQAEYSSKLLTMNKAQDPKKKIHSNNYLSIFAKNDILPLPGKPDYDQLKVNWIESIKRFFQVFLNPKKESILKTYQLPPIDEDQVLKNQQYLLDHWDQIEKLIAEYNLPQNTYVKIFFVAPLEVYYQEYQRYVLPKIFNKNDYNIQMNEEIFGLSNYNMGLNTKKPYLESLTTAFRVPFRTSLDDALVLKDIFEWLSNQRNEEDKNINTVYLPLNFQFQTSTNQLDKGMYIYFQRGKETIVKDFEFLSSKPQENFEFEIYNYLNLKDEQDFTFIDNRLVLEKEINQYWYNKQLIGSYYAENKELPKIKLGVVSKNLINLIIISRDAMLSFFRKGNEEPLKNIIQKIGLELIQEQIRLTSGLYLWKAQKAYNLWLSFLSYYKKEGSGVMADKLQQLVQGLENKIDGIDMPYCECEEEFYFLAGQLTYYLLSQSVSHRKSHSLLEPFLRVKKGSMLKEKIIQVYETYGHAIHFNNKAFKRLLSMVMGYDVKSNLNAYIDIFLAGVMCDNILYRKKEQEEEKKQ
ncbi:MAG: hypothetical protein GX981_09640 [Tissierellia bacterium]|nr:hypothetical protein [Tissierellia bacterium]